MHGLEAEYWGRVDFVYLDREDPKNAEVVALFGIKYQPVFILLTPDGQEIKRWYAYEEADFRASMDAAIQ